MSYRAVFRCIAGCPGEHSLEQPIYRCPTCGDLLEVSHDIEALRDRSAGGVDAAVRRALQAHRRGPTARRCGARRSGCCPSIRDENIVSMDEGGTNLFWAERFGRALGPRRAVGQAVRQLAHRVVQGPRDDGARLDGQADDRATAARCSAVACASTGDTSASLAAYAAAAGIPAIVILPRGKVTTAQLVQPLANGAHGAVARHRLRRLHGHRAAAGRRRARLPRQLDEQPAARGTEDRRHRDRAAVRLAGARRGHHPGRQPRATSARSAPAST